MSRSTRSSSKSSDSPQKDNEQDSSNIASLSSSNGLQRQIAFVTDDLSNAETDTNLQTEMLPHPRTGKDSLYILNAPKRSVHEVLNFAGDFRSWFIKDCVCSNGDILLMPRIDPVFLALSVVFRSCKEKYSAVCQLHDCNAGIQKLIDMCSEQMLLKIADVKHVGDLQLLRYNSEKTLTWLEAKVKAVSTWLESRNISDLGETGSVSSLLVRKQTTEQQDAERVYYAWGIVSEYLCDELAEDLKRHLKIQEPEVPNTVEVTPPVKKPKLDLAPTEDYSSGMDTKENKPVKLTTAQKKLAKVDKSGMRTMSAFFTAKSKK